MFSSPSPLAAHLDLVRTAKGRKFGTILADPPWQFQNRTGKVAPEHKRLNRYGTMELAEICALPVADIAADPSHLYLWVPNALLPEGMKVLDAWGFRYVSNIVWHKIRKDGGSDGRGVGFYFRNVTEILLFGVRGKNARTLAPGRSQVNMIQSRKREHSRKPDEQYKLIEDCSWGPRIELFSRGARKDWTVWGNQADDSYKPDWATYSYNSAAEAIPAEDHMADGVGELEIQHAVLDLMKNRRVWTNAELKSALSKQLPWTAADLLRSERRPNEKLWENRVNNALSPSRRTSLYANGFVENAGHGRHRITDAGYRFITDYWSIDDLTVGLE